MDLRGRGAPSTAPCWSAYRLYGERAGRGTTSAPDSGLRVVLETAVMFAFTLYGWLLFRAASGAQILDMTTALWNFESPGFLAREMARLAFYAWPVVLLDYLNFRSRDEEPWISRKPVLGQALAYAAMMLMFIVFGRYDGASFIYFQF